MLTKFETRSNRVKGLSFHPRRPWLLVSLHSGSIQLWNFQMATLLDRFDEHEGAPVRGIAFHPTEAMFVSGGDDYKIKVWSWKLRRCMFTLLGHLDYIRTVEFHHTNSWILSASDDQTIRIWSFLSRTCISVLTGHNHYVMCASFHPRDDLIVSASLDQTVRVWDTAGLRKKSGGAGITTGPGGPGGGAMDGPGGGGMMNPGMHGSSSNANGAVMSRVNSDLFGNTDAVVKYVLEGHERGVNWASFHPSMPLIVSGADDRQVKLWRMSDTKAWEVDTMRGHSNNVSCVLFHPNAELIISNSEDRSIRIWDVTKRTGLQTFRREHDRFWILAVHPHQNLIAAGHDSGMIVFKLERERPAFVLANEDSVLYYVKDRYLRQLDFKSNRDVPLASLRRSGEGGAGGGGGGGSSSSSGHPPLNTAPRELHINTYNPTEVNILTFSPIDGGTYELLTLGKDNARGGDVSEPKRGQCLGAVFIARNRFLILDQNRNFVMKNLHNEVTKKFPAPYNGADAVFHGGTAGRVLVRFEDKLALYETQSRRILVEMLIPRVRHVVWSADFTVVSLVCKHQVVMCNRNLEYPCIVTESVRIKGGCWSHHGIFFYTTTNHVKYCLPNGDSGMIRSMDAPVYATKAEGDTLTFLDREAKIRTLDMDTTEAKFKLALFRREYRQVLHMIRNSSMCGQAIITYLQERGYPEVALHFVEDTRTRFDLAIACGNLEIAKQSATELKDMKCWHRLGVEALRQGDAQVMEIAFQKTKDFSKLSFLYLITGNTGNLKRMLRVAETRKDIMSRFHNALFLGSVPDRVKVLEEVGQLALAYVTAATHGLQEDAARIKEALIEAEAPIPDLPDPSETRLMMPPTPIMPPGNWPTQEIKTDVINAALAGDMSVLEELEREAMDAEKARLEEVGGFEGGSGAGLMMADEMAGFHRPGRTAKASGGGGGSRADAKSGAQGMAALGLADDDEDEDEAGNQDFLNDSGPGWNDEDDELDLGDLGGEEANLADAGRAGIGTTGAGAGGAGAGGESDTFGKDVGKHEAFVLPSPGTSRPALWCQNSSLAADHVAAGAFEQAMQLLNRQIGAVSFGPLKQSFRDAQLAARCFTPGLTSVGPNESYFQRNDKAGDPGKDSLPRPCFNLRSVTDLMKTAYARFQKGRFSEALEIFLKVLHTIPLTVVSREESMSLKESLASAREYVLGIRLELERKRLVDSKEDGAALRAVELSVLFTKCGLQPSHLMLALKPAMVRAFKLENYITSANLARRLVEMPQLSAPKDQKILNDAKRVLAASEKQGRNVHQSEVDESKAFEICSKSFSPIYSGSPTVRCPYCGAVAKQESSDQLCSVCEISQLGLQTLGLVCSTD